MKLLPETASTVHKEFMEGKHLVTRSSGMSFNSVWSDLGLEQSVVKDSKSRQGGIIGFSRQQKATMKWYLTAHERSAILQNFRCYCGLNDLDDSIHKGLKASVITQDEKDVQRIMTVITDRFRNPFVFGDDANDTASPLTNIATGVVVPSDISQDLLNAREIGRKALTEYAESRLNTGSTALSASIKRLKLKTFSDVHKKNEKQAEKAHLLESDRDG